MGQENVALYAFNRGMISRLALARIDVKRASFSADLMENWMPRVMGAMSLRAGLGYLGALAGAPRYIPFIFATDDTAIIEFTNGLMRVWVDDALVTRASHSSTIQNGDFAAAAGWTDDDEGGGVSTIGGTLALVGNDYAMAARTQQVAIAAQDQATLHALRIVVTQGVAFLRVGTTSGADDLVGEATLGVGIHSITFTPGTTPVFIRLFNRASRNAVVESCDFEAPGTLTITSPYSSSDLGNIRFDQSADVIYLACDVFSPRKIERRDNNSWSLVHFMVNDGPLRAANGSGMTLSSTSTFHGTVVTASAPFFKSTHAPSANNDGAIFRFAGPGQNPTRTLQGSGFTHAIKVEGAGTQRSFTVTIDEDQSGTGGNATFTLQRSTVSEDGPWTDVQTWAADVTVAIADGYDNQILWYRLGIKSGDYVNGTHFMALSYAFGTWDGYFRVTSFLSSTQVNAEITEELSSGGATEDWSEGEWSDHRGWPSANSLAEGRLWWFGKQGLCGSISDGFESHDENFEGDAGAINRDIGSGPFDQVSWGLALSRLIAGGQAAEYSLKSSSLDEPLTPTNFNIRADSTQGSASVQATKLDKKGHFVQRGGTRVFELDRGQDIDYGASDLTILIPEICQPSISRMAVQRQPDTRLHCVLTDGTVALAVIDRVEGVLCWFKVTTREDDAIVDVVILPGDDGTGEDAVYYAVQRSVNGSTVYYHERWALEEDCIGETLNKQADAFIAYTQAASSTITGLSHLVGCEVVVWDNGKCLRDEDDEIATFTVAASGQISVTNAGVAYLATTGIVGLSYTAQWKSAKLAYAAQGGSALNQRKKFDHLGVILDRTHHRGLKYGPDFNNLSSLPLVEQDEDVVEDTIHQHYDEDPFEFEGEWKADSRLCLEAQAPRPATILAATLPIEERSKK